MGEEHQQYVKTIYVNDVWLSCEWLRSRDIRGFCVAGLSPSLGSRGAAMARRPSAESCAKGRRHSQGKIGRGIVQWALQIATSRFFLSKMAILACKIIGYFDTLLLQHFPWPRIHQSSSPRPALNDNFSTESYRFWDGTRKILRLRGLPTCRFVKLWQLLNEVWLGNCFPEFLAADRGQLPFLGFSAVARAPFHGSWGKARWLFPGFWGQAATAKTSRGRSPSRGSCGHEDIRGKFRKLL